jgi:hypothetical protein
MLGGLLSDTPQGPDRLDWELSSPQPLGRLVPALILAGMAKVVGVTNAFIAADFIFPAVLFCVIVLLARSLKLSLSAAVLTSVIVLFGDFIIDLPINLLRDPDWAIRHAILSLDNPRPVEYARTWVPQLTFSLFLLAVLATWYAARAREWYWPIAAGLAIAVNSYTYAYSWPVLFAGAGICALLAAPQDTGATKRVLIAIAIGIVFSGPVLWAALNGDVGPDLLRYGHGQTGLALGAQKHRIMLTALLLLLYPWQRPERPLMQAFLLAPWICVAASMVSGTRLQEFHWVVRSWLPWTLITLVAILDLRAGQEHGFKNTALWIFALLLLLHGANRQYQSGLAELTDRTASPHEVDAIQWVDENLSTDCVVVSADWNALGMVPANTRAGIYLPFGPLTHMKMHELLSRFAHTCASVGKSRPQMHGLLEAPGADWPPTSGKRLPYYWVFHMARGGGPLTAEDRQTLDEAWRTAQKSIRDNGRLPYRADVLWISTDELPVPLSERWQILYQNPTVTLMGAPERFARDATQAENTGARCSGGASHTQGRRRQHR